MRLEFEWRVRPESINTFDCMLNGLIVGTAKQLGGDGGYYSTLIGVPHYSGEEMPHCLSPDQDVVIAFVEDAAQQWHDGLEYKHEA